MPRLQIRMTLEDVEPEIWRLVDVEGSLTLDQVHDALQIAMGWTDSHLHLFEHPDGRRWSSPTFDLETEEEDERTVTLAEVVDVGRLRYEYDFGDSWSHRLEVVGTGEAGDAAAVVRDGARCAPPEDCGGAPGYEHLLETLGDPTAEDHDALTEWVSSSRSPWNGGSSFDPEAFDLAAVNATLRRRFEPATATAGWGDSLRQVVAGLPPGARTALGDRLAAAALEQHVELDPEQAAESVRPFAWLLERVSGGLTLTSAGRLPPAVVREASDTLGWGDRWVGTMNREDHVPAAANLRLWATRTVLVRKHRGALLLTRAGAAARRDPAVLLRHLASRALRVAPKGVAHEATVLLLAERAVDSQRTREELLGAVAFGLHLLGYADQDRWSPPTALAVRGLLRDVDGLLGMLGLAEDFFRDPLPSASDVGRAFARIALQEG